MSPTNRSRRSCSPKCSTKTAKAFKRPSNSYRSEYEERESGLQIREIAGGWQIATRTEFHEEVRKFLKTRPSAKLSLASLETLAVIAYKQPVTVPEILEIRGVQSASAIKTLLDKRLIVAKGRKETVGRPMQYGTSKDFLIQFGLKDLSELAVDRGFRRPRSVERKRICIVQRKLLVQERFKNSSPRRASLRGGPPKN